jgi:hypothetical protein
VIELLTKPELSACRKGEIAEALFAASAMVMDFEVFTPKGHSQTADLCLVRSGCRPMTVQDKTAYFDGIRGDYSVNLGRGLTKEAYRTGDFDVLAAYLPDLNQFVLWTLEDLKGRKKLRYSPERHRKPSNWELLDDVAQSLTISGIGQPLSDPL